MTEKHYTNNEITVVWKPDVCNHSRFCWTSLPQVFHPRATPWINMEGAETARIVEQVKKCPSGALSFFYNQENKEDEPAEPGIESGRIVAEVIPNGPLIVHGNLKIKAAEGKEVFNDKVTAFCRCGASTNKPFCDGSHKKIDFKG